MPTPLCRFLPLLCLWLTWFQPADPVRAEEVQFPPDAGVVDVTKFPYFAKGDGITDDTEAIQQALLENGDANRIIYLPNGTYRISATLRWPGASDETGARRTILQGQSRAQTIIRLFDHSDAFANSGRPQPMIWTGSGGLAHFRNAVRNLTLHTSEGNPGASGLQFAANKQGCVRDVDIVAGGDGTGATGLDLSYTENIGPLLVKNVRIRGFDTAVRTSHPVMSVTFEDLEISGQKVSGIRNSAQIVTLRRFRSTNSVSALQNTDGVGFITLLDSTLQGLPSKRASPAIVNRGVLFVRNVTTPGYASAIENRAGNAAGAPGPDVREYLSHNLFTLFAAPPHALNLPVEETPEAPVDQLSSWASPSGYGSKPDDQKDASEAFQAAVNSGARTIYLPNGTWILRKPVELGRNVHRIIGCEARLLVATPPGQPGFRVGDGPEGSIWFERLDVEATKSPLVELAAPKRLIFSSCLGVSLNWKAPGSVFLEDVASFTHWEMGADCKLWARQWCLEFDGPKLVNKGGLAWLMGWKTERAGTLLTTTAAGRSEVLGGLCLANGGWKSTPMVQIEDASATLVMAESSFSSTPYQTIVEETRKGVSRRMSSFGTAGDQTLPVRVGGVAIPLYTGYDGVGAVEPRAASSKAKPPH